MNTPRSARFSDAIEGNYEDRANNQFGKRLRLLIGDQSNSAFARQVGLSESLIRKYLNGSEPSLSKAWQIARQTNTSLYWLAGAPEPDSTGQSD